MAWTRFAGHFNKHSQERIIGKFFINPEGEVLPVTNTHQEYAFDYLKEHGSRKAPTPQNKILAEDQLKESGWIRGQIYQYDGLAIEGTREALNTRGINALEALAEPRRVIVQLYPEGTAKEYLGADVEKIGWDKIAGKKNAPDKNRSL